MNKRVVENQHRSAFAFCRDKTMVPDELAYPILIADPEWVTGGAGIERGAVASFFVRARYKKQWTIKFCHIIQKNMQIERFGFCDTVLLMMCGKVVVPRPRLRMPPWC